MVGAVARPRLSGFGRFAGALDTPRAGGWAAIIRDEFGCTYQGCGYGSDTSANYVP